MIKLTTNAISTMLSQGNGKGDKFIVEAINVKLAQEDFLKMEIKDSTTSVRAYIYISRPQLNILEVCSKLNNQNRYLIKITQFTTQLQKQKLMIQILDFIPLTSNIPPKATIQESPKNTLKKQSKLEEKPEVRTEKKQTSIKRKPIQHLNFDMSKLEREQSEADGITEEQLKQFEKISDLYIDFQGRWEIVVRVIEKSYRQFTSKNNKLTKIFTMTLIDRTGMKIEGVMFGENAKQYHDLIQLQHIYRMSRCQVREQNYGQKIFSKNSSFIPIAEIKSIPRGNQNQDSLQSIIRQNNFDKIYTFPAILLEIGQERHIEKQNRIIFKKTILIGDPQIKKSIQVIIWNKDMIIDEMWMDRAIMVKNFKLHNYRDTLSFSSIFRSQIAFLQSHRFNRLQGKYDKLQYESISGASRQLKQQDNKFRYIKQIQNQLMYSGSQPIISDLQVWISHMNFKNKWFYQACNNPKCKKQAESNLKCFHCGHNNGTVLKRFIIPVQLSDYTGSLYTTAFDQFSHDIFKGITIDELARLEEIKIKEEAQCRLYQQYKIRISSKKQLEGNIKHSIIGKPLEINLQKASISNVQKIKRALY